MSKVVLKVEDVSKLYRLGEVGTGTISHDLNRWWAKVRGKEDPFAKIGQINDRTKKADSDYVWALKDINFEVNDGDVIGIIGRNGAGKSTLLKIISQITSPTTGSIKAKGRIAALLEVGTGMNPELTAKENIYLNGAILGMRKYEIDRKFDEIIDFSGCAMYINTPLKRFSSGMRVRLGFAVAAFLEPEILIVDEVLAVGDAEFQTKAIGKMQDVSRNEGRTVLFVSHNMASVASICTTGILMQNGQIDSIGEINQIIEKYRNFNIVDSKKFDFKENAHKEKDVYISNFEIVNGNGFKSDVLEMDAKPKFCFTINSKIDTTFTLRAVLFDNSENRILAVDSADLGEVFELQAGESKTFTCELLENLNIRFGDYRINVSIRRGGLLLDHIVNVKSLTILEKDIYGFGRFSTSDMAITLKSQKWT